MSKIAEIFAKDLLEIAMINAVDFSVTKMKQDNDDNVNDDVEKARKISSAINQQLSPQDTKQTNNLNINQILRQVAQLAENINEDLKNIQIGDYVVSMNASPLEIQVKQAISSLVVPENTSSNKIYTKGEGDCEHQDTAIDDELNEQLSINQCNIKDLSSSPTSSSRPNALLTVNAVDPQLEVEQQLSGSLKRKKYMTLGERIRRIFRFTFNRRRNL